MSALKLGLNENISNEDYHAGREYVSSSGLKTALNDIEEFHRIYILGEKQADKTAFHVGTYAHTAVLEPHLLDVECAVYEGVRRGAKWEAFKEENAGKALVTDNDLNKLRPSLTAHANHAELLSIINSGEPEVTAATVLHGLKVKARCDLLRRGDAIWDVKTTSKEITYDNVLEACFQYDYDLSAALYLDVFNDVLPEEDRVKDFIFYFFGKTCGRLGVFKASEEFIANGRKKVKKAIDLLIKCRQDGVYKLQAAESLTEAPYMELIVPKEYKI